MDANSDRVSHGPPQGLFSDLFEHLPIWVFALDSKCQIRWSNRAVFVMLGYRSGEIGDIPDGFASLLSPRDKEAFEEAIKDAFARKEKRFFRFRTSLCHRARFSIYVLLCAYFFFDGGPSSSPLLFFYALNETEKVLLSRLTDQDKRLITIGTMTAEIAHEIKNAIIAIGGLAMLAKRRHPDIRELDIIQSESYRLERLTKSINSFVRPGQKNSSVQVDALGLLRKSLCLLSPEIKKSNVKIDLKLCPELKALTFDNDTLMEVYVNLIRNALEALRPGGKLEIGCFATKKDIMIDFKNKMEVKRVNDPKNIFQPIDQGGHSIGLPISRKIISNLGGELLFRQLPGGYALFRIKLPLTGKNDFQNKVVDKSTGGP